MLIALHFCLKVGMSKILLKLTLTFDICDLFAKFYHKIDQIDETLPAFHILVVQITIPCINHHELELKYSPYKWFVAEMVYE